MSTSAKKLVSVPGRFLFLFLLLAAPFWLQAQTRVILSGSVLDPQGALVPNATLRLASAGPASNPLTAISGADGKYEFRNIPAGTYQLQVVASGFESLQMERVELTASRQLNLTLKLPTAQQQVNVNGQTNGVSVSNTDNTNTTVISGSDLDALSDDPDQLRAELLALAGPSAGPDGGQFYLDGFSANQLPPKSSILEVRVNQNPFSAENDAIGYGRIDIITKPGAPKITGHARFSYLNSALDTSNPLVQVQPHYQYYSTSADVAGPITKTSSYLLVTNYWERQRQAIIDAVDPTNPNSRISLAFPSPYSTFGAYAKVDFQLGKHVMSLRDSFLRTRTTGAGVGGLNLQAQSFSHSTHDNAMQFRDFAILNSTLVNEFGVQWELGHDDQLPDSLKPAIIVTGSFVDGGNVSGQSSDHVNNLEVHDYLTATHGLHVFRFGMRLRSFADSSLSTEGTNGTYTFNNFTQYQSKTPSQYQVTVQQQPTVKILTFDAAFFFQDEWRARPNLSIGYGLRVQGQNRHHDPVDFAPRVAFTWAPHNNGHTAPRFAIHGGFGIFYTSLGLSKQLDPVRYNGFAQESFIVNNPMYDPNASPASVLTGAPATASQIYTLAKHFHAAQKLQGSVGFDRALGKQTTLNVSYLFTQGTHQFYTNNITAPVFDPATYTFTPNNATTLNYQVQSGGIFKQHQLIFTARTHFSKLSLQGVYTLNYAASDTAGGDYFPTDAQNPGLDYGRASFDIRHQLSAVGSWALPHGFTANALLYAQSGTPFNITTGTDLTGNHQYNARPTFAATCTTANQTAYGCFDTNPTGKSEKIIPINFGTGPKNMRMDLTLTKTVGVGPRLKQPAAPDAFAQATAGSQGSLRPGEINTGAAAATASAPKAPRRYSLNFQLGIWNLFNIVNRATPNGVLGSPLFGQSQAIGPYQLPSPGNRTIYLNTAFTF